MDGPLRDFVQIFRPLGILTSLTLPILSWFNGAKMTAGIRRSMGESTQIEDLWIPYFCTSTNLSQSDLNIHTQGSLWFYCRASMGVVGLLPPMIDTNGDLLIDGGYTSNLPADVMASKVETVIAMDVENKDVSGFDHIYNYGDGVSGWWILWQKLTLTHRVPLFGEMVNWLSCINHTRQLISMQNQPGLIDLYVRPLVQHFGLIDYHLLDEISAIGFQTTIPALRRWLRTRKRRNPEAATATEGVPLEGTFLEDYTLITPRPDPAGAPAGGSAASTFPVAALGSGVFDPPSREPSPAPFSALPGGLGSRRPSLSGAFGALHPGSQVLGRLPTSSSAHNLSTTYRSGGSPPRAAGLGAEQGPGLEDEENLLGGPDRRGSFRTERRDRSAAGFSAPRGKAPASPQILSWANAAPQRSEDRFSMVDQAEYRRQKRLEQSIGHTLNLRSRQKRSPALPLPSSSAQEQSGVPERLEEKSDTILSNIQPLDMTSSATSPPPSADVAVLDLSESETLCFDAESGELTVPKSPVLKTNNLPLQYPPILREASQLQEGLDSIPSQPELVVLDHVDLPRGNFYSPEKASQRQQGGLRRNVSMRMLTAHQDHLSDEHDDGVEEDEGLDGIDEVDSISDVSNSDRLQPLTQQHPSAASRSSGRHRRRRRRR